VISTFVHARFEDKPELLELEHEIEPHKIFRSKLATTFFAENSGKLTAAMNSLKVTGTRPDADVVLRYHYLETFVCEPGCTVEREPLPDNPVGFVRVPAPHPPDFAIVNRY
jgi:hypothetical protein